VLIEHRAISEAVRSGDADQAAASMALHLTTTLAVLRLPSLNYPSVISFESVL
jgi:DNA-binding GntR family transcriptional regulator